MLLVNDEFASFSQQICCPNIISNALNNRLAGAKAIAARAQPLGKDTMFNKFLMNNVTKLKVPFYTRLRKKKKIPDKRGGRPPPNLLSLAVHTVDTAPLNNISSNLCVGES